MLVSEWVVDVAVAVVESDVIGLVDSLPERDTEGSFGREEHADEDRDVGRDEGGHTEQDGDGFVGVRVVHCVHQPLGVPERLRGLGVCLAVQTEVIEVGLGFFCLG